jgi:hypothetical protein
MARRPPLTQELRWKARTSLYPEVYASEDGKFLARMLPSADETDQQYVGRIGRFDRFDIEDPNRPPINPAIGGILDREDMNSPIPPFLTPQQMRARNSAREVKASILHSIDVLANSWVDIGERFLAAAEDADPERLEALAAQGAPLNYHDPRNGATALHYIAAQGARPAFRVLLKSGPLDFLARDGRGRLASELAGTYGRDLAMERFLLRKAIRQAREKGIPTRQIYRRDAPSRSAPVPNP